MKSNNSLGNLNKKIAMSAIFAAIMVFAIYSVALTNAASHNLDFRAGRVENTTLTTTVESIATTTIPPIFRTANATASGGFLNASPVTFIYTSNYTCVPGEQTLIVNNDSQNASTFTSCEVGAAGNVSGAFPVWVTIPAYAGLSIFGVPALGSSSQGFPTFNNQTIATECGGGGSLAACPDHPTYLYSPVFTEVEQHIGIFNGIYGLPEGTLPTPSHDHIVNSDLGGASVPWYAIGVLVFDPNIVPNVTTGKCTQVVPSNLSNATGNCLNSLAALDRALVTSSSDVATVNANNPIYQTLAGNTTINSQVVVPGAAVVSQISNDNTNLLLPFEVKDFNFYNTTTTIPVNTTIATTSYPTTSIANTTTILSVSSGSSNTALYAIIVVVVIIIILLLAWKMMKKK